MTPRTTTAQGRISIDRRVPLIAIVLLAITCACSGVGAAVQVGALRERFDLMTAKQATAEHDHDTLIEVKTDVSAIKSTVERMEARQRVGR